MKFGSSKNIAIKEVYGVEIILSISSYKPPHLRILFQLFLLMSHAYDVINKRFKEREPRNCFPWKSWDIIKNIIFSESDLLPHAIIEVRTFSVFTESHQMVRKSSIWLNQLSVEISTLKSEKNIFFALDILYCITHTRTFFFFSFSSHMTAKSTSKLIFL